MIIYNFKRFIDCVHILSVITFACILRAKKIFFASTYLREWQIYENFASTYFCEWQVFENFEFINFSPKEKTRGKRQLNQEVFG